MPIALPKLIFNIIIFLCSVVGTSDYVFQDEKLKQVVEYVGHYDWQLVSRYFHDRSDLQCQHRWYKVLNPDLIKGPWTKEVILLQYVNGLFDCFLLIYIYKFKYFQNI